MKKRLKRLFCVFLVSLLLSQEVLADVAEPVVASASDAMIDTLEAELPEETVVDFDNLPEYDPLAGLTDEQYAAYCQTFIDHPSVLLDYPEGVPQPRFAVALSAAAVYVLYLLAAAVGIVFTWNLSSWVQGYGGYDFFSSFEQYMRVMHSGAEDFWASWDAVMNATWGQAVTGMKTVYKYLKEYCVARMEGYGTEQPSYNLSTSIMGEFTDTEPFNTYITSDLTYLGSISMPAGWLNSSYKCYVDYYYPAGVESITCVYFYQGCLYFYGKNASGGNVSGFLPAAYIGYHLTDGSVSYDKKVYNYQVIAESQDEYIKDGSMTYAQFLASILPFPYFMSSKYAQAYVDNGDTTGMLNPGVVISVSPEKSIVDVQEKTFTAPADTITLPADQTAVDTIGSKVSAATDAATVTDALTGTWDLGDTQAGEDTDDAVYPWVPDITGWLEKLKQGIDAIRDGISAIPDTLTNILDGIQAIPGQIADFFTLDMAAINTAYVDLTTTFQGRFSGLYALSSVFNQEHRTFDDTPPVFTMPVPDALKIAYPDTDTMVIMDLRQHAAIFKSIRLILTGILWYMFAVWLLNQFDVKFHIG